MQLATDATNANGNALANQEKYMDSFAGLIQSIKTEFEAFAISLSNDSIISGALGGLQDFLSSANDKIENGGSALGQLLWKGIEVAGVAIPAKIGKKWAGSIVSALFSNKGNLSAIGAVSDIVNNSDLKDRAKNLRDIFKGQGIKGQALTDILKKGGITETNELKELQTVIEEVADASDGSVKKITSLDNALSGLATSAGLTKTQMLKFFGVFAGVTALAGVIALAVEYNKEQEKMRQLAQDSADTLSSELGSLDEQVSKLRTLRSELENNNTSEERRAELKEELYQLQSDLTSTYDIEAEKLDLVNGKISEQINLLEGATKQKAASWLNNTQDGGWLTADKTNEVLAQETYNKYKIQGINVGSSTVYNSEEAAKAIKDAFGTTKFEVIMNPDGGYYLKGNKNTTQQDYLDAITSALEYLSLRTDLSQKQREKITNPLQEQKSQIESFLSNNQQLLETYAVATTLRDVDNGYDVYSSINQLKEEFTEAENDKERDLILSKINDALANLNITEKEGVYNSEDKAVQPFVTMLGAILGDSIVAYQEKARQRENLKSEVVNNTDLKTAITSGRGKGYTKVDYLNPNSSEYASLKQYAENTGLLAIGADADTADQAVRDLVEQLADLKIIKDDLTSNDFDLGVEKSAEDAVSAVKNLSDAISGIDSAIDSVNEGTVLNNSGIASLEESLSSEGGLSDESITNYVSQMVNANNSAEKQLEILKNIKTEIANVGDKKIDLTGYSGNDLDYLISQVEKLGYTYEGLNGKATASADAQVAAVADMVKAESARVANAVSGSDAIYNASMIDVNALEAEAKACGVSKEAYYAYYVQKMIDSGVIDTSRDISALATICQALGIASNAWLNYYRAKANAEAIANSNLSLDDRMQAAAKAVADNGGSAAGLMAQYRNSKTTTNKKSIFGISFSESIKTEKQLEKENQSLLDAGAKAANQTMTESADKAQADKALQDIIELQQAKLTGTGSGSGAVPTSSGGGSSGSSKEAKEETQDWIDWYERRISVLQKLHDAQEEVSNDEMKSYADRSAAVTSLIEQDQELLNVYNAQAENYKGWYDKAFTDFGAKYANENGVITDDNGAEYTLERLKELIENGGLEASSFTGDKLEDINELITSYDDYYAIVQKVDEKEKEAAEHWKQYYDMRIAELEEFLTLAQGEQTQIENQISLKQALGQVIKASDYESLIANSKEQVGLLEDQIDTYEEMLDDLEGNESEYNQILAKIQSCENSIYQCKINQVEWNEAIKDIPITRIEKFLNVLSGIQSELTDYMSNQISKGNANSATEYIELMTLGQEQMSKLLEQQKLYKDKLKDYEWGSDKYDETVTSIDNIDSSISSVISSMTEWSLSILKLPVDKITEVSNNMQTIVDALDEISSKYDEVISAVTDSIDDEIDKINDERDATEDAYQDKIDAIQDVIDALEKENTAREKQLAVEQAQYDLEKAYNERSVAVIKNGKVDYEADQDAIRDAQQNLDDANYNKKIYELQQEIENLEEERDKLLEDYDDRIEKLQDIAEKWSEITENIEHAKDVLSADEFLGDGWLSKVLSGDDNDIYTTFKNMYEALDKNRTSYEEQIESNNRISSLMQKYVEAYVSGAVTYEDALKGVKDLTNSISSGLSVTDNLTKVLTYFGEGDIIETLNSFNKTAETEAANYQNYFEAVKKNAELTDKYTKTWEEMQASIQEQLKALKEAYEAAIKAAEATQEAVKTYRSSGGGSETTTNYVIISRDNDGGYKAEKFSSYSDYSNRTNGTSGSISGTSSGKTQTPGKAYVFHEGLEKGYVGALTPNAKLEALKKLSLTPLKDYEVPAILKAGEIVMTSGQQDNLLKNVSKLGVNESAIIASSPSVTLNMSNLTFNEVQNGKDFANFITKNLTSVVAQNLSKK